MGSSSSRNDFLKSTDGRDLWGIDGFGGSESHLSHGVVDLRKLLHFDVMLTDKMLFLLCQVTKIAGGRTSENLTRRYGCPFRHVGSGCDDGKTLDSGPFAHTCTHSNV